MPNVNFSIFFIDAFLDVFQIQKRINSDRESGCKGPICGDAGEDRESTVAMAGGAVERIFFPGAEEILEHDDVASAVSADAFGDFHLPGFFPMGEDQKALAL